MPASSPKRPETLRIPMVTGPISMVLGQNQSQVEKYDPDSGRISRNMVKTRNEELEMRNEDPIRRPAGSVAGRARIGRFLKFKKA